MLQLLERMTVGGRLLTTSSGATKAARTALRSQQ